MSNNTTDLECFEEFGQPKYIAVLIVRIFLSFISCCVLLSVIGLIMLFKKYRFMAKRLILYLACSSFTFAFSQVLNFDSHIVTKGRIPLDYCVAIAFATEVTIWWEILTTACIMVDIFLKVIFQLSTEKLEKFYVIFIFGTPLLFSWVPFIDQHYGSAGLYCWIRDRKIEDDCQLSEFGNWLRFSLYYIPLFVIMGILVVLAAISLIVVHWRKKKWVGKYSPEHRLLNEMIEKEIKSLILYPFIFIFINIVPLIRRIYSIHDSTTEGYFALTVIQVIIYRFQGILIGMAFTLDPETRKQLKWSTIKAAVIQQCYCYTKRNAIRLYPAENVGLSDSKNSRPPSKSINANINGADDIHTLLIPNSA